MTYSTPLTAAQVQIARSQAQSVASSATSVIGSNKFVFFATFDGTNNDRSNPATAGDSQMTKKYTGVRSFNIVLDKLGIARLAAQNTHKIMLQDKQYLGKPLNQNLGVKSFNIALDRLGTTRLTAQNINEIRLQGNQYLRKLLRFQ